MKIKYICDYCGKEYDSMVACSECENTHKYIIKKVNLEHFPNDVTLEIGNGLRSLYKFESILPQKEVHDINGNITYSYTTI